MGQETVFHQKKWSLTDLYTDHHADDFQKAIKRLNSISSEIGTYREKLTPEMTVAEFHDILSKLEEMTEIGSRLMSYAELLFSSDTQNGEAMALIGQVQSILTEADNQAIFISLWWKSLTNEQAEKFFLGSPDHQYYLQQMRNTKAYMLPEASEQIINIKDMSGSSALNNLYQAITNRYQFTLTVDGKEGKFTRGGLMQYARDHSPAMRKQAYQELYRVYGNDGNILGQVYQSIVRDWYYENVKIRKYSSPITVRNINNDIPDAVVDLMLETCRKNKAVFQRYFKLKKNLLGLDVFTRYDIYAPLKKSDKTISFEKGFEMVQKSFANFDPEFAEMALKVFRADHVDSEVRHGKRDGAFCLTASPKLTPWVMLNYQGKVSDVSTMAHELGHAIHSISANQHNIFESQSCLPLAETASTFAEMILIDAMLSKEDSPEVRRELIMQQMDDNYATIQRQAYFALFEKEAHQLIPNGADVDMLNKVYLDNLKDQFGDSVVVSDEFKWEWASIPHIYATPFYVYAYAFGQLLVLSLYQQYKKEGATFIPKYKKMLAAGGSKSPENILIEAGFNFRDPAFWQGGFDVLSANIDTLEADL